MKRIVTLMLAAGLILGGASVTTASAVEIKAGGQWQFSFGWGENYLKEKYNSNNERNINKADRFRAIQRIRPTFQFIADENLSATLQLEIGKGDFGNNGWALGNDGNTVKVRYGYVDWVVPGVGTKVRMGMLPYSLPSVIGNNLIYGGGNDLAGVVLTHDFCENLGLTFAWTRPENDSTDSMHDVIDTFSLSANVKGDGWNVAPWVLFAPIGNDVKMGQKWGLDKKDDKTWKVVDMWGGGSNMKYLRTGLLATGALGFADDSATKGTTNPRYVYDKDVAWFAGIGIDLTLIDPLRFAVDFAYGSVDLGKLNDVEDSDKNKRTFKNKRKGWGVNALLQYKMDFVTPGLQFWYVSGDDANIYDGSERMPYLYQDNTNIASGFSDTGFGPEQNIYAQAAMDGTWALQLRFDNINYGVEGLSHDLRALYAQGTNNTHVVHELAAAKHSSYLDPKKSTEGHYLTTSHHLWQVSLDTKYQIYKNLTAILTLAYMKYDLDKDLWFGGESYDDNNWAAAIQMQYKF